MNHTCTTICILGLILRGALPSHAASTWRPIADARPNTAVWMASATTGWTVGEAGLISRTTDGGATWVAQNSGTAAHLHAVWGTNAGNVWAVGDRGTILRWNGTDWSAVTSGTTQNLWGVHGTNGNNVWAVGETRTILKWNGSAWSSQTTPGGNYDLNAVFAMDATNLWAVGTGGKIIKGDGSSWSNQTSGTSAALYSVWASSTTNIIAVGDGGTVRRSTNGTSWGVGPASIDSTTPLRCISGVDATHVWAVGDAGLVEFFDGTGGFTAQTSNTTQDLNGVFAFSSSRVIAVGTRTLFNVSADGSTWTPQVAPTPPLNFTGVWALDDDEVWFSGPGGVMMRYDGSQFTAPPTGVGQTLKDVHGADRDNVWAVGNNGRIIKWDGSSWAVQVSGSTQTLNGVHATTPGDVWAVGNAGTILHFNGTAWSAQTSGTTQNLNAVWAADATNVWAAGAGGTILKLTSGVWKAQSSGIATALNALCGASKTAVWATGANGTILKFNGSTWAAQTSGNKSNLRALAVVNATNQWTAGGTNILKGTGTVWAGDGSTGFPYIAFGAWATGTSSVFLATQGGMIFVNSPASVPEINVEQPLGVFLENGRATIDFGSVVVPGSQTKTFTIQSTGNADLTGLAASVSGPGASSFHVSALASTTLAPSTSTTFDVTFTPPADGVRTATLTIASDDVDEAAFTISLTGTGQVPVSFSTQPASKTVNPNTKVTFTCAVPSTVTKTVSYQWQKYDSMTMNWTDVPGATAASYVITKAVEATEGDYRVVATNPVGSLESAVASLSVNDPIAIIQQPMPVSAGLGDPVSFTVVTTGTDPRMYQWRKNGVNISNATGDTLTLPSAQLINGADYSVVISNVAGSITSSAAALTVIDTTLKTLKLPTGGTATITAAFKGKAAGFVWKRDGAPLPADFRYTFKNNVLTIKTLQVSPTTDAGVYTCEITGLDGGSETAATTLVVYSGPPEILGTAPLPMGTAMVGDPTFTFQVPVDPDPLKSPTSYTISGLPAGLTYNKSTGLVSGRPTVALTADKVYNVTLKASNAKGSSTKSATLLLKALPASAVGTFTGLVEREVTLNKNLGGRFDMTTTSGGACSGKLTLGAAVLSFKGILVSDATGAAEPGATVTIVRKAPLTNLAVSFTVDTTNHVLKLGDITDGSAHAAFDAWRKRWGTAMSQADSDALNSHIGYYTFSLKPPVPVPTPPETAAEVLPQGIGYGSFIVAKTGALTVSCRLPEGTTFTTSTFCGPHGEVLVFRTLHSNLGSVVGALDITPGSAGFTPPYGDSTLAGKVEWLRPAILTSTNHIYRNGFGPIDLDALGGRYFAPATPDLLLGVTDDGVTNNASLAFSDGGIDGTSTDPTGTQVSPDIDVRIKAGGAVVVPKHSTTIVPDPNPRSTTLAIKQSNGTFSGRATLVDPNPAVPGTNVTRTLSYYGLIIRDSGGIMRGFGHFVLPRRPDAAGQTVSTTDRLSGVVVLEKLP